MLTTTENRAKHATAARMLSLALAAAALSLVVFVPDTRADDAGWMARAGLAATLIGAVGAAGHGLGLLPRRAALRRLLTPATAWPMLAAGVLVLSLA